MLHTMMMMMMTIKSLNYKSFKDYVDIFAYDARANSDNQIDLEEQHRDSGNCTRRPRVRRRPRA